MCYKKVTQIIGAEEANDHIYYLAPVLMGGRWLYTCHCCPAKVASKNNVVQAVSSSSTEEKENKLYDSYIT
jgi:hypothetical protein